MVTTLGPPPRRGGRRASTGGGAALAGAPLLAWCDFSLTVTGRVYRALLVTLVVIAMAPNLWNWSSFVVRSGSMEPAIATGDVVVAQPFGASEKVPLGRVMIFHPPAGSGGGSTLRIHRVVGDAGRNTYTTAGDANVASDPIPVPRAAFKSRAIIRVPFIGLPLVWLERHDFGLLAIWLAVTAFLLYGSFRPLGGEPPPSKGTRRPRSKTGVRTRRLRWSWRVSRRAVVAVGLITALAALPAAAAAFSSSTVDGSNRWTASVNLLQPYTTAVITDLPYAFYLVDESSGSNAADRSGNNRTGTFTAVAAYGQVGALPGDPGYSIGLVGNSGRMVGGGTGLSDPSTFSVEMWFKTTTAIGGKLIGFENSRSATSTAFDREAFMRTDGKVVYMGATSPSKFLVSPTALNNGLWHQLVITSVPSGGQQSSAMYVDGSLVAAGSTNRASSSYVGWWRVGFGKVPTGAGYPTTGNFTGSVDNIAVYTSALTSTRVTAHYAAR